MRENLMDFLSSIYMNYIHSVSQKWVHSSHFCRYLSISLHGTTLTKITLWHNEK